MSWYSPSTTDPKPGAGSDAGRVGSRPIIFAMNSSHARASFVSSRWSHFMYCRFDWLMIQPKSICCSSITFARIASMTSHTSGFLRSSEIAPYTDVLAQFSDVG